MTVKRPLVYDPDAVSHVGVTLGRAAVAIERREAQRLDRLQAEAESRPYEPVQRSVAKLLCYTGGVSWKGQLWLEQYAVRFERVRGVSLEQAVSEAGMRE